MMTSTAYIPTLALSSNKLDKEQLTKSIQKALSTLGFLYITHPKLNPNSISTLFKISKEFFTKTSEIEKLKCTRQSDNMGYVAFKAEQLDPTKDSQGDTKEAFNLGRLSLDDGVPVGRSTQLMPSTLQCHLSALYEFQETCRSICVEILELLAISFGLPEDVFSSQHQANQEDISIIRLLYYPATQPPISASTTESPRIRAGAHSDYGSLTLLIQESDGPTGLQVLTSASQSENESEPDNKQQVWKDVAVQPGAILVNIGDALEFWTGGQLKSTIHRVIQPTHPKDPNPSRFSIAYFCQPDPNAILSDVLRLDTDQLTKSRLESKGISLSETLTSREHLARRHAVTYL
ncbi:hypothetical protein CROQUDRAFT_653968 [Cronartium quercuum f. sp. fusiforme G11]|uniref:Fe2OG dioxygenase domain-containing protein n=1 Tax=Cronartium quercuum f. sp. fusiforme G11 TaxID=708437 RepID=A0A9P6NS01_9BASI|nr:hypothetical protein CROQUDRAFT_653968 [Cronartium quercuum f. sp. fusiforme G11]